MAGGRSRLVLKKDREGRRLFGNWPIPYNPRPGTYLAEVMVTSPGWASPKNFHSAFTIQPLKPQGLYSGYAALTLEGGKQLINGAVPALDGSDSARPQYAIDWAKFMGANMFCFLMGQTSVWDHLNPSDFPFSSRTGGSPQVRQGGARREYQVRWLYDHIQSSGRRLESGPLSILPGI